MLLVFHGDGRCSVKRGGRISELQHRVAARGAGMARATHWKGERAGRMREGKRQGKGEGAEGEERGRAIVVQEQEALLSVSTSRVNLSCSDSMRLVAVQK